MKELTFFGAFVAEKQKQHWFENKITKFQFPISTINSLALTKCLKIQIKKILAKGGKVISEAKIVEKKKPIKEDKKIIKKKKKK